MIHDITYNVELLLPNPYLALPHSLFAYSIITNVYYNVISMYITSLNCNIQSILEMVACGFSRVSPFNFRVIHFTTL